MNGVPVKVVSYCFGHANLKATMI
ncbi:hypothetical protein GKN94_00410 [Candidatus Lucifugimonas marina]|uniref:Uncharacterized protein n=1 Tax=Candidatus Lucifugimonas marina TaxID=3038979 RepID=A0AAJ5ZGE8_9CHLR|nr:hypothetical protein [SAR202 cluster bacterium JH702]MDG0869467.1 hypothetical protein [SAR202 cluster bacterium JH639]WFG36789.1 hypothetical protein GKN94_00410 [SAR202 cluster bacterium JH545]WFG40723.1 hypothetical protein GKO48_00420 [SAR202 cluster bacterium JH1073]